ncbi:MAG TPA: hypothetical protein VK781_07770 [Solirubrobacteraceae bacterium]|nr:hypothetical protein [Solirubrobacteraceae bacterium]
MAARSVALVSLCSLALVLSLMSTPIAVAAPPVVEEESVLDVAGMSATLQARIGLEGQATEYRFEYGPSASYGSALPTPNGLLIASPGTVTGHPQDLQPATTYHFRIVAIAVATHEVIYGADKTFTTQPVGSGFALQDMRSWEMVSPPNKHGGRIEPLLYWATQAAEDGSAITYHANGPVEAAPPSNELLDAQVLSKRGPEGWSSQDISTPHDEVTGQKTVTEYKLFSADLSLALVEPWGETPLTQDASGESAYMRDDADGSYRLLPRGSSFLGASLDLSHVVVTAEGPSGLGLYELSGENMEPVSILPESTTLIDGELGDSDKNVKSAVSRDGSRVFWSDGRGGASNLYVRDMRMGETLQVNALQGGSVEPGQGGSGAHFLAASSDGSKVFFTDASRLTADSTASPEKNDLYEFDVSDREGRLTGDLRDLTIDHNGGEAANVQGVLPGISEDGSYVYFVADGVLAPGASPGTCENLVEPASCNLYVSHDGTVTFISMLSSGEDLTDWEPQLDDFTKLTSRVSSNGRYIAFMSSASLTGYDNRDASSSAPDEEVYIFDAGADRLVCASCDPTGARPAGMFDTGSDGAGRLVDRRTTFNDRWLAALIPGWTTGFATPDFYQSRYLSDAGRLFFDSVDALVPQDINGTADVYEYEPEGTGSCAASSSTFSGRTAGCVSLISSGASAGESTFLDASASGDDAFFLTDSQLVSQDLDTSLDVYDARTCTSVEPCPAAPVPLPPCSTSDSCKAAPTAQPAIFGLPASATFSGVGNIGAVSSKSVAARKRKSKPKARSKARKHKHKRAGKPKKAKRLHGVHGTKKGDR